MPKFLRKPCDAILITRTMELNGKTGAIGDWLVIDSSGIQRIVKKKKFLAEYTPANSEADAYLQEVTSA